MTDTENFTIGQILDIFRQNDEPPNFNRSQQKAAFLEYVYRVTQEVARLGALNEKLINENKKLKLELVKTSEHRIFDDDSSLFPRVKTAKVADSYAALVEENKGLRFMCEKTLRQKSRLEAKYKRLNDSYGKLFADPTVTALHHNDEVDLHGDHISQCECSRLLKSILDALEDRLETHENIIWRKRVDLLEQERDDVMIRNLNLVSRLAQLEAHIVTDPFLADKFGSAGMNLRDPIQQMQESYKRLEFLQEGYNQLERRLAIERSIARSWQPDLRTIQKTLQEYISNLTNAVFVGDLSCSLFKGGTSSDGPAQGLSMSKLERESLRLLRHAKQRIEADTSRLTAHSRRIKELESEVSQLKVNPPAA